MACTLVGTNHFNNPLYSSHDEISDLPTNKVSKTGLLTLPSGPMIWGIGVKCADDSNMREGFLQIGYALRGNFLATVDV